MGGVDMGLCPVIRGGLEAHSTESTLVACGIALRGRSAVGCLPLLLLLTTDAIDTCGDASLTLARARLLRLALWVLPVLELLLMLALYRSSWLVDCLPGSATGGVIQNSSSAASTSSVSAVCDCPLLARVGVVCTWLLRVRLPERGEGQGHGMGTQGASVSTASPKMAGLLALPRAHLSAVPGVLPPAATPRDSRANLQLVTAF